MQAVAFDLVSSVVTVPVYRSVSQNGPAEERYIVLTWGTEFPFAGATGEYELQIWAYDIPGDYGWIDATLSAIRDAFLEAVDLDGADGGHYTSARWNGRSTDLYDDVFKRVMRYASITIAGHQ